MLPPNSTHVCQPLDVGVFKGLKVKWRQILLNFRKTHPTAERTDAGTEQWHIGKFFRQHRHISCRSRKSVHHDRERV